MKVMHACLQKGCRVLLNIFRSMNLFCEILFYHQHHHHHHHHHHHRHRHQHHHHHHHHHHHGKINAPPRQASFLCTFGSISTMIAGWWSLFDGEQLLELKNKINRPGFCLVLKWATKTKTALLSMRYCLFNRDPYNHLSNNPYING